MEPTLDSHGLHGSKCELSPFGDDVRAEQYEVIVDCCRGTIDLRIAQFDGLEMPSCILGASASITRIVTPNRGSTTSERGTTARTQAALLARTGAPGSNRPYSRLDDPQSLNLYSYVENSPLSRVDADGHMISLAELWSGASGPLNLPHRLSSEIDHARI